MLNDVLDVREASQLLRVSERKLYAMAARREVPFARVGRSLRFTKSSLEAWLRSKTEASQQEGGGR
jgi:excisionase family DNA binding protein